MAHKKNKLTIKKIKNMPLENRSKSYLETKKASRLLFQETLML